MCRQKWGESGFCKLPVLLVAETGSSPSPAKYSHCFLGLVSGTLDKLLHSPIDWIHSRHQTREDDASFGTCVGKTHTQHFWSRGIKARSRKCTLCNSNIFYNYRYVIKVMLLCNCENKYWMKKKNGCLVKIMVISSSMIFFLVSYILDPYHYLI